jgi:hypothetical protein
MAELFLEVNWPAPKYIRAITTTRNGGQSTGPYFSLNLGDHVGDNPEAVAANRQRLLKRLYYQTSRYGLSKPIAPTLSMQNIGKPILKLMPLSVIHQTLSARS